MLALLVPMNNRCFRFSVWVSCLTLLIARSEVATAADAAGKFDSQVKSVLQARCVDCHSGKEAAAGIDFAGPRTLERLTAEQDVWFRALDQLRAGTMPPKDAPQLSPEQKQTVMSWIVGDLADYLIAEQQRLGRTKLRRLTREEYANTVLDLCGVRPSVGVLLPEDGRVDGYTKVSGALPLSATSAAGYFRMAEDVLKWVLKPIPRNADERITHVPAQESGQSPGHSLRLPDDTIVSFNTDTTSGRFNYGSRVPGVHRLKISVYGYQTDKPLPFGIYAGLTFAYPQVLDLLQVHDAPPGQATVIETEVYLRTRDFNDLGPYNDGLRLIPYGLGVQVPKNTLAKNCNGPGLAVQWMDVEQPEVPILADRWMLADFPAALLEELRRPAPPVRQIVLHSDDPKARNISKTTTREEFLAVMEATLRRVGARLYRRDLAAVELAQMLDEVTHQVDAGEPLTGIFAAKMTELLTAPEFLCVIEQPGRLDDFALASRLAYFLWNSTPDDQLLDLARQGKLGEPQVLHAQTERMLADPRSARFVSNFVGQWLGVRGIDDTTPDRNLYPEYNDFWKISSVAETQIFFQQMLSEDLSVTNFVDSDWAMVNAELAERYSLPPVEGGKIRKVQLPQDSPHGGLWTQSAILKVTANGTNTSPVKRGVWVAERLLGIRIPPPPPNIEPVQPDVRGAKTLREQLALHRGEGSCANCHARFDPYGFALESFDVTGQFREKYREVEPEVAALPQHQRKGRLPWRNGLPVDCSGETPDGRPFANVQELREMLVAQPEQLAYGVTSHLVTYATGTPPHGPDKLAIEKMIATTAKQNYGLRSLVHAVVQGELFRSK